MMILEWCRRYGSLGANDSNYFLKQGYVAALILLIIHPAVKKFTKIAVEVIVPDVQQPSVQVLYLCKLRFRSRCTMK